MKTKESPAPGRTDTGHTTGQLDVATLAFTRRIVEQQLGEIDDQSQGYAYCSCPGAVMHTSRTGNHDCRVYYQSGAPTVYCLHTSCSKSVVEANRVLRSNLGKSKAGVNPVSVRVVKSADVLAREREQREGERLAAFACEQLPHILLSLPWPASQIFSDSPGGVADNPEKDWRLLLTLFRPDETLWIGDTKESGVRYAEHFRPAVQWLKEGACPRGPLILPAALKSGVRSRTKIDVARLPFLVVESDTLGKDDIGAVFRWLRENVGLALCAVVDTGSRSLHGWFARPDAATLRDLRAVLPALACDGAVLRDTQPVRLPGCLRPGKSTRQTLLYFDREAAQ